jgi:hypothetical protein
MLVTLWDRNLIDPCCVVVVLWLSVMWVKILSLGAGYVVRDKRYMLRLHYPPILSFAIYVLF